MLNILERATDIGARDALNFVGLAWRDGRPVLNEGPDCYFTEPDKQCPYHNLQFPSGTVDQGVQVINAYQAHLPEECRAADAVWNLGAHLKAFLGFWPHMIVQANKGAGKSTIIKRMERNHRLHHVLRPEPADRVPAADVSRPYLAPGGLGRTVRPSPGRDRQGGGHAPGVLPVHRDPPRR